MCCSNKVTYLNDVNAKIKSVAANHTNAEDRNGQLTQFLYPAKRWHLYDKSENGQMVSGQMERVKLFALIAGFILVNCLHQLCEFKYREKRKTSQGSWNKKGGRRKKAIAYFSVYHRKYTANFCGRLPCHCACAAFLTRLQ